jgi:hypothetical protein
MGIRTVSLAFKHVFKRSELKYEQFLCVFCSGNNVFFYSLLLSPPIFNFALDYVIRKVQENPDETEIKWDASTAGQY